MTCPICDSKDNVHVWRRNTMYCNDSDNLMESCYDCILEDDYRIYFQWCEYYGYTANKQFSSDRLSEDYVK